MSATQSYALRDSATMLRRNLRHAQRYPGMTIGTLAGPIVFLLVFVYVLGGALRTGVGALTRSGYLDYLAPGIILLAVTSATVPTAVAICTDMTEGIVARFRTMAVSRASMLTGHVVGAVIQTMASVALVLAVAVAIGFRPTTDPGRWAAAIGLLVLLAFAVTWLAAALGLVSTTPEGASNIVIPLAFLPFLGSAFVPTDSMAVGVRWFAEYQPFTPIIGTLRDLLLDRPVGSEAASAVAWCVGLGLVGYLWARALFSRDPAPR